jgi:hypothetical protein
MDESGQIPYWSDLPNPPERVRAGQRFVFRRSGWDVAMREHCPSVEEGQVVRVIQMPSAPKPGTMGQVHIEDANTGEFLGMCSMKSLSTPTEELERTGQVRMVRHNPMAHTRGKDIHVGDHVMYAREFLVSTGTYTGPVPFAVGVVKSISGAESSPIATIKWDREGIPSKVNTWNLVRRDRRSLEHNPGEMEQSGGIHIDIGSHNANPPLEILSDKQAGDQRIIHYRVTVSMKTASEADRILHTLYPQWRVTQNYSLKPGTYPGVAHAYGVQMKRRSGKNPPLPASALMDITTAKITAREVEEGSRPMGNLGTVDYLLDRGLQKLRGSHMGQVDWENPPGKVSRHIVWQKLRTAKENLEDLSNIMSRHLTRGVLSSDEYESYATSLKIVSNLYEVFKEPVEFMNPPAVSPVTEIYRDIVEIKAIKPDGKRYVHRFGKGSNIYGMSDGTILIRSRKGKRLWKNFKQEG